MLSRRLLIAGGGGSFSTASEFTVTAAPDGAWPGGLGGQPFYYAGTTYFGFADNSGGIRVGTFVHATGTVVTTTVASTSTDQHNRAALVRRVSDGRFVTAYSNHDTASFYYRVSTNPDDLTAWDTEVSLHALVGGTAYTYPFLFRLGSTYYLFYRDNDGLSNWEISTSSDGEAWSAFTNLVYGTRAYARAFKSSETRFDVVVTDGSYAEDYASLYHFYCESGSYYTSDGSSIAGSPPFAFSSLTKIYDGATAGVRYPAGHAKVGSEIAVVFPVQTGTPSGHIGEDEDYLYARWNGATWSTHTVAAAVGATDFEYTEGSLAVDPADLDRVVLSKRVAGVWQVHIYTTTDNGVTWSIRQISDSVDPNIYPEFVNDHALGLQFVWLTGTFTTQSVYDSGIQGYGTA